MAFDTAPAASPASTESAFVASSPAPQRVDHDMPTLALLSRRYIERVLERTGNNKTRAARMLGIDRRTLNRMLARERVRKNGDVV